MIVLMKSPKAIRKQGVTDFCARFAFFMKIPITNRNNAGSIPESHHQKGIVVLYGVVFLDEVGETPLGVLRKLLLALQVKLYQRLCESYLLQFRSKWIAATNRDLGKMVADGNFRQDFYYCLSADRIKTPPLQEMIQNNEDEL